MQDVEQIHETAQASGAIEPRSLGPIKTLSIEVFPSEDSNASDCGRERYRFVPSFDTFVFEDSPPHARCELVCKLVDPDGKPFPAHKLNFTGCKPLGRFFEKHPPTVSGKGSNTLQIHFDFSSGNASGALELDLSNGQHTQRIAIFNASRVLERSNDVQVITITRGSKNHYSHAPETGILFNNASKEAPSLLFCVLTGPDGLPSRDDVFTHYKYDALDNSTVLASGIPKEGTNVLALWFFFGGVAAGGALKFCVQDRGAHDLADSQIVDPQVVNVPTTGSGPG